MSRTITKTPPSPGKRPSISPDQTKLRGLVRLIAVACVVVGVGSGIFAYRYFKGTYHLATVREGVLYRDGARSLHELGVAVTAVKAHTVVSLIDDKELADPTKPQFAQEESFLTSQGVAYHRIPVALGGFPASADIQAFLAIAEDSHNWPVLLHCAQGVRRTAMFVAAYQETEQGFDKQRAKDAILSFGHSADTIDDIKNFIDHYDPQTRTVSDLPKK